MRRADGSLTFIDFEYFGWDDPVKLGADFLWHPAMRLSDAERSQFAHGITDLFGSDPEFAARLAIYFPLYGIRWSLIILNGSYRNGGLGARLPEKAAIRTAPSAHNCTKRAQISTLCELKTRPAETLTVASKTNPGGRKRMPSSV